MTLSESKIADQGGFTLVEIIVTLVAAGILSSLQPANLRLRRAVADFERASKHPGFPLLFDPQTAGGLLAGVPPDQVDECLKALQLLGYADVRVIGKIKPLSDDMEPIKIIH